MVICIICLLHNLIKQIWLSGEEIKWSSDDKANFVIEKKKLAPVLSNDYFSLCYIAKFVIKYNSLNI